MDLTRDRRLAQVQAPTLVIWGAADKVNRPSAGASLASTMPNCDLYLAAKTGHWVQWERPDLFNSLALNFLGARR
jgi:2-hydroxy-6-oxonona-2,4-dienedioate hydrolase/4,5:9,10-diseco-3-hydroxy-5,9,17-trioxoandrosta-1(10),2-diene-4-oate hydrolase